MPRFIFESIALPSSTAGCTPSKNKLRSDSTTIPPTLPPAQSQDETSENSLTPSIISLTDRLHVTFADNHTDLISVNGTPVTSRANSHHHELNNIPEDEHHEDSPHIAKTIFHDGDSDNEDNMTDQHIHDSEMKIESISTTLASPSGRIKKHGNAQPILVVVNPPTLDDSLKSNLSPCKRSRSS